MKVSSITTKTIEAETTTELDAAVLAFVGTLGEQELVDYKFAVISGGFVVHIIYTQ